MAVLPGGRSQELFPRTRQSPSFPLQSQGRHKGRSPYCLRGWTQHSNLPTPPSQANISSLETNKIKCNSTQFWIFFFKKNPFHKVSILKICLRSSPDKEITGIWLPLNSVPNIGATQFRPACEEDMNGCVIKYGVQSKGRHRPTQHSALNLEYHVWSWAPPIKKKINKPIPGGSPLAPIPSLSPQHTWFSSSMHPCTAVWPCLNS